MIAGIFHEGSGLGDQLFRYITVRSLALDKGYEWGMWHPQQFKGDSFMMIDKGDLPTPSDPNLFLEKEVREGGLDVRSYDPEINFVGNNTLIDGSFEDDKYWGHHLNDIREWLKVEPLEMPEDLCVIGFRGGEYYTDPALGLPKSYYDEAIALMRAKYPNIRFEVHTDDPIKAKEFFDVPIVENAPISHSKHTNMGYNWRAVRYAHHLIISNSSFYIIPSLLNENVKEVIAPRFWARRNIGVWARPACYYKRFQYI